MSDERLRELERSWKETATVESEADFLLERLRAGRLTKKKLEMMAYFGSEAGQLALHDDLPFPLMTAALDKLQAMVETELWGVEDLEKRREFCIRVMLAITHRIIRKNLDDGELFVYLDETSFRQVILLAEYTLLGEIEVEYPDFDFEVSLDEWLENMAPCNSEWIFGHLLCALKPGLDDVDIQAETISLIALFRSMIIRQCTEYDDSAEHEALALFDCEFRWYLLNWLVGGFDMITDDYKHELSFRCGRSGRNLEKDKIQAKKYQMEVFNC